MLLNMTQAPSRCADIALCCAMVCEHVMGSCTASSRSSVIVDAIAAPRTLCAMGACAGYQSCNCIWAKCKTLLSSRHANCTLALQRLAHILVPYVNSVIGARQDVYCTTEAFSLSKAFRYKVTRRRIFVHICMELAKWVRRVRLRAAICCTAPLPAMSA